MERRHHPGRFSCLPSGLSPVTPVRGFAIDDPIVREALQFIMENRNTPIKVKDVIAQVPASGRSLERHFLKARGCTMAEEIARLRLERVKRLLVETELPVKEIASISGFSSESRLCQAFRRIEGASPGAYRERPAILTRKGR